MNRDTVIGIVGAVILVAAMVGVFQYERTRAPGALGDTPIFNSNFTGPNEQGSLTLGASADAELNVTTQNMTNITFTLTWTPQATPPGDDTFKLVITPPSGVNATTLEGQSSTGTVTVVIPIGNAKPTTAPTTLGVGAWTAKITFVSTSAVTPPPPVPVTREDAWKLAVTGTAWAPGPTPPS